MKNDGIPTVVLNFNQINNPTQINHEFSNSVQTIGRKIKEISEDPLPVYKFIGVSPSLA